MNRIFKYLLMGMLLFISINTYSSNDYIPQDSLTNQKELVIINGKSYSSLDINMIDTFYIKSIVKISPEEGFLKYGDKGKHGIILVTLKEGFDYSALTKSNISQPSAYYLNGKVSTQNIIDKLSPSQIATFEVKDNIVYVTTQ